HSLSKIFAYFLNYFGKIPIPFEQNENSFRKRAHLHTILQIGVVRLYFLPRAHLYTTFQASVSCAFFLRKISKKKRKKAPFAIVLQGTFLCVNFYRNLKIRFTHVIKT
ncbi:hypothetical protein ACNNMU_09995, partial [Aerococcus viridans]